MYNIQKSLIYFRITDGTAKRRGGIKLLKSDLKFQRYLLKEKFINKREYLKNVFIYGIYRVFSMEAKRNFTEKNIKE